MTSHIFDYQRDALGFPAVPCYRCGGTGRLPQFGMVHRGVCFKCEGSKLIWPTDRVRREALEARQLLRAAAEAGYTNEHGAYDRATGQVTTTLIDLRPGMIVRPKVYRRGPDGDLIPAVDWRTIATVRRGACLYGGSLIVLGHPYHDKDGRIADRDHHDWWIEAVVTFTDGTRARIGSDDWEARPGDDVLAEVERLAAKSRTAYEKTLARRAARERRAASALVSA